MAPPTLTHSKLFSLDILFLSFSPSPFFLLSSFFFSFSFSIFFFFFCNLGLIMGGDFGFDFGQISPLLWAMILGEVSVVASYSSSSSSSQASSSSSFAIWVWLFIWVWWFFFFFKGEVLINLGSRFRINLKNLMICVNLLLDSREDRGERE